MIIYLSNNKTQMKNIESRDLPFRTINQFYTPLTKQKTAQGIKVFPRPIRQSIFAPQGTLPSIVSYVSGLNEAKNLPRRIHNRHEYISMPRSCKRHKKTTQQRQQQKQSSTHSGRNRINTLLSNNTTNRSMLQMSHKYVHPKLQVDKEEQAETHVRQSRQKQIRFSFYNTIEKSNYFIEKFKQDKSLHERRTSKYQNMIRRNITAQTILSLLDKSKQQFRNGS